jgi:hypothetical protein
MPALSTPHHPAFHYRPNRDGTIDSICGACFLTVASAKSFEALHGPESAHPCVQPERITAEAR